MPASPFESAAAYKPVETVEIGDVSLAAQFDADPAAEYRRAKDTGGLVDRSGRGLIRARGADRRDWLGNLVTNAIKPLNAGGGAYAFAADVRGRTLFDLNVLALADELWLDLDARVVADAHHHLDRHLIMEDVQLSVATDEYARLGVCGPAAPTIANELGCGFDELLELGNRPAAEDTAHLVRHSFAGLPGFELFVPRSEAAAWWDRLAEKVRPIGCRTVDVLRIEAGIPWYFRDIDDKVIPPETGQVERGISYHKGCYLGQEVIERMRSHGSLARRLVRLRTPDGSDLELPADLALEGKNVGRITSLVPHPADGDWIGLGYLRTKVSDPAQAEITAGDPPRSIAAELLEAR